VVHELTPYVDPAMAQGFGVKLAVSLNPFASPAAEDEEEEKKKRPQRMPGWLLPTAGVGVAGLGLGHGIASDAQADAVRRAAASYDPRAFTDPANHLPKGHTGHTYYEKILSPAAQLTPFGRPVGDYLVNIRSSPDMMKHLGTENYGLYTKAQQEGAGGRPHYRMFAGGQIPAYAHQMGGKFRHVKVPTEFGATDGSNYSEWMGQKFRDYVAQRTGQNINPFEVTPKLLSNDEQNSIMEGFSESLSPEEQAFRVKTEDPGPGYAKQLGNYLPKAEGLLNARDALKNVGAVAGGAGLGGLLGHYLTRGDDEDEEPGIGHTLATLGGAGLGGAAGYFGGTDPGRRSIMALMKKIRGG